MIVGGEWFMRVHNGTRWCFNGDEWWFSCSTYLEDTTGYRLISCDAALTPLLEEDRVTVRQSSKDLDKPWHPRKTNKPLFLSQRLYRTNSYCRKKRVVVFIFSCLFSAWEWSWLLICISICFIVCSLFGCLLLVLSKPTYHKKCNGNYDKSIQSPHLPWRKNVHDTGYRHKKKLVNYCW